MCGLVGVLTLAGAPPSAEMLDRMTDIMAHRGPDDRGTFVETPIALGFRRLAIVDLSYGGHQPMLSPDGRHVIVFNGEIYNHRELRAELELLGHVFRSASDTEVLLAAYREWGRACLPRLNGMWAFIVWDRKERTLFGARDRFGVKPLYFVHDREAFAVASEIKALRGAGFRVGDIDWNTLATFTFADELDASDETFYRGIRRVPAGTSFTIDTTGSLRWESYWSLARAVEQLAPSRDPIEEFGALFEDSVRLRMRSDVKSGVLLSGGLDSTSIVCAMARQLDAGHREADDLQAFSFVAPEFDESSYIDETIRLTGARRYVTQADPRILWDRLERHLWIHDGPVHSMTSLVSDLLLEQASRRGVKVLLNGQGADECLAGYPSYFPVHWSGLLRSGQVASAQREISDYARAHGRSARALFARATLEVALRGLGRVPGYASLARRARRRRTLANSWFTRDFAETWSPGAQFVPATLDDALRYNVEVRDLPLYLRLEDRNSMGNSVEVRLPFLDYRLVSLAFRLEAAWKIRGPVGKVLLRESARGRVPESVRSRVSKLGFPTPADRWFRTALYEPMRDLLASESVRSSGLWNVAAISQALEAHRRGAANFGPRLFDVAQVAIWLQQARQGPHKLQN